MGDDSGVSDDASRAAAQRKPVRWPLWLALGLLAGLLVAGGAYFGLMSYRNAQASQRQKAFETAENHYAAAAESLTTAHEGLSNAETTVGGDYVNRFKQISQSAKDDLVTAKTELALAEEATKLVEDAAARTALTEGIGNMRDASFELGKAAAVLPEAGPLVELAEDVDDLSLDTSELREDTVQLSNKKAWSAAAAKNKKALVAVSTALTKLDEMEALRLRLGIAGNGIEQSRDEMKLDKSILSLQAKMIAYGKSGRYSSFNSTSDTYNTMRDKLDDVPPAKFYADSAVFIEAPLTSAASARASLDRAEERSVEAREAYLTNR